MDRRLVSGLVFLALLLPACKAAGPKVRPGAPVRPDLLAAYPGSSRLLRHKGDQRNLTVKVGERLTGECDVAVRVRTAAFEKAAARFSLETVGLPSQGGREAKCKRVQPAIQLVLTGFPAAPAASDVTSRVDEVLQTPDAYLKSKGIAFDLAPGKPPTQVASEVADASGDERTLARRVTVWPRLLLSVNPYYHGASKKVRYEGLLEFEATVGTDGRAYQPRVKTGLGEDHEKAVASALSFWRFEPARRGDAPVGARIPLTLVLRIY